MQFRIKTSRALCRATSSLLMLLLCLLASTWTFAQIIPSGDIRIHYFRPDGNYSGWTVYAFDNTTEDTGNYSGGPVQVTGTDSYGAYFDVGVTTGAQEVGIIIHNPTAPGGDQKDTPYDLYVDPATEGTQFWSYSGIGKLYNTAISLANPTALLPGYARIHYHRPDGNYANWTVYAFDDTTEYTGDYDDGLTGVTNADSFGAYFDIGLIPNAQNLGFIIHNISTGVQDPGGDMYLNVGTFTQAWVISGDTTVFTTPPSTSCATSNPNPNPNPASFAAVADFNGDCKSDILWRNTSTQQVYEWFMNGTTYPSSGSPGSPTSDWVIQGTGDFNGDGYADILWRNSTTGEVFIWLMNGSTLTSSGSLGYVFSDWTIKGVGDFNGDGKADILWRNSTTGQVYVWFINGTTMSGGGSVTYITSDWVIQGIGDFNGDGKADILWRNSTTGQVYIWLMNGATLTTSGSLGYVSSDWSIAGVGDFNGDGKSDILWRNSTSGQVYLWLINGTTMSGGGSVTYVSSAWVIEGLGDYDGSGRAGILWRNTTTEQVYIWLMNGATLTSSGTPGAPATVWQIQP
jgi:hypothetical protein